MGFFRRSPRPNIPKGWRTVAYGEFLRLFPVEEMGTASFFLSRDFRTGKTVRIALPDGTLTLGAVMNLQFNAGKETLMGLMHPWARFAGDIFAAMDEAGLLPPTDPDYHHWPVMIPDDFRLQLPP